MNLYVRWVRFCELRVVTTQQKALRHVPYGDKARAADASTAGLRVSRPVAPGFFATLKMTRTSRAGRPENWE